jgi:predicted homoserine dehydrogenase-like protein
VREIDVDLPIERERLRRARERLIRLGVVVDGCGGEASEELVNVADALDGTEWVAVAVEQIRESGKKIRKADVDEDGRRDRRRKEETGWVSGRSGGAENEKT